MKWKQNDNHITFPCMVETSVHKLVKRDQNMQRALRKTRRQLLADFPVEIVLTGFYTSVESVCKQQLKFTEKVEREKPVISQN